MNSSTPTLTGLPPEGAAPLGSCRPGTGPGGGSKGEGGGQGEGGRMGEVEGRLGEGGREGKLLGEMGGNSLKRH